MKDTFILLFELPSFLESRKRICESKHFYNIIMPSEDTETKTLI